MIRFAALLLLALAACARPLAAGEDGDAPAFARTTIDIGVVCSDVEKSIAFYEKALGFQKSGAFSVPAKMGARSGLSDARPFDITVMTLGDDDSATKLKLMEFSGSPGKRADQRFIHSTLGPSYLTVFVTDLDATLARAKKHGVKPIAKGPIALPESIAPGIWLALVRDPDGNFVELVGPRETSEK